MKLSPFKNQGKAQFPISVQRNTDSMHEKSPAEIPSAGPFYVRLIYVVFGDLPHNYSATLLLKQRLATPSSRFNQIQPKFYRIAILLSNFQEPKGSDLVEFGRILVNKKYT